MQQITFSFLRRKLFILVTIAFSTFTLGSITSFTSIEHEDVQNLYYEISKPLAGGAYSLNFSAADPSIYIPPIPYPTSLSAPLGRGNGDPLIPLAEFNNGSVDVKVESLAPEDMALGQIVPFELMIDVNGDTTPENGEITFLIGWNTLTTNGGDFGYDARPGDIGYGVIGAFIDTGDGDYVDSGNNATVSSFSWQLVNDEIVGVFTVGGLDDGDMVVMEAWLVLDDTIPAGIGGNVQSRLIDAVTGGNQDYTVANSGSISLNNGDAISTGNQTVPLLKPSDFFSADVDLAVTKIDLTDPVLLGEEFSYQIVVSNNGLSVANSIVLTDELNPNLQFISSVESNPNLVCSHDGSSSGGLLTCNIGALAPGESVTLTLNVKVLGSAPTLGGPLVECGQGADLENTVMVSTISNDTDLSNNTDCEPTDVEDPFICPTLSNETTDFSTCEDNQGQTLMVQADIPDIDIKFFIFSTQQGDPYVGGGTQLGTAVTPSGGTATSSTGISGLTPGTYYAYAILDTNDPDLTDPNCRPFVEIEINITAKPDVATTTVVQPTCEVPTGTIT
ncbi:DUF11 domain-containing protein, partial [Maribacter algicola]